MKYFFTTSRQVFKKIPLGPLASHWTANICRSRLKQEGLFSWYLIKTKEKAALVFPHSCARSSEWIYSCTSLLGSSWTFTISQSLCGRLVAPKKQRANTNAGDFREMRRDLWLRRMCNYYNFKGGGSRRRVQPDENANYPTIIQEIWISEFSWFMKWIWARSVGCVFREAARQSNLKLWLSGAVLERRRRDTTRHNERRKEWY